MDNTVLRGPWCEKGGSSSPEGGAVCFSGSLVFWSESVISHRRKVCASFTFLHALKKYLRYEKFQTHTKVRRTCNEARTPVPNIQQLSGCRSGRLICPLFSFSFPLLEYFKANPRHHVISPSCTSVCIKKFSVPPAIFRTRCYQEPLRQASFSGDLCGRSTPGLALQGFLPSLQSGTHEL